MSLRVLTLGSVIKEHVKKLFYSFSGAYLYRRERKKRPQNLTEKISESLEQKKVRRRGGDDRSSDDGSSGGSHSQRDEDDSDDGEEMTSSEIESSGEVDEERVPLELSDTLKRLLEEDHELITKKNKVSDLRVHYYVLSEMHFFSDSGTNFMISGVGPECAYPTESLKC
jgi:hypothetical protein